MVFQNPDNQIIGTVVEEDVGFGPENLGVPTDEIWQRVEDSLKAVGMISYRHHSPNKLSGGQKQRVAIAGVIAMKPRCIVLDEPTAMLDPNGRKEVLRTVEELRKKEKVTVILITHYMEEVIDADKVFVMDHGHVVMEGTPREIFSQVDTLKKFGVSTRDDGTYALAVPAARYHLRVSYVGFRPYAAEVDATSSLKLPDIFLKEDRQMLDAITVTGKTVTYNAEGYVANIAANKQLQQLPLDRMLAFLPGMYVDREKMKVYMKEISTVYINDRAVRLTGQELIDHLKAYDGKNIQKIEVIVNNGVEHAASDFGAASIRITTVKVVEGGMFSLGAEASYSKTNKRYGNPWGNVLWRYGKL